MLLLMMGNGLQGTLLGVRGALEGISAAQMSYVMSAYFIGMFTGSRFTPLMIRRVGHVRVFAALASFISAAFILYAAFPNPYAWFALRLVVGFCFSGVYVVAESWLNDAATNETRGKTLSVYLIVQMLGIIAAQAILNLADPSGYQLFVLISVLVSISFAPILLSVSPAPVFPQTKPMSLRRLYVSSPLGTVGTFILGGVFAAQFGMSAVYGTERGMSVSEISIMVSAIYIGGLVLQFPIGWLSDRTDRRMLIVVVTAFGAVASAAGAALGDVFAALLAVSFVIGGVANPLYGLLVAHTNDFLEHEDMAAASGGLIFLNGLGAVGGPVLVGYAMGGIGPWAYFGFIGLLFGAISLYALYRMTQRPARTAAETGPHATVMPQATQVAMEVAQEVVFDQMVADAEQSRRQTAPEQADGGVRG
jgi:MFS family permease